MIRRILAIAASLCLATTAIAQEPAPAPAPAPAAAPRPATVKVTLQTSEGPILLELESERAPKTTANFLRYVDQKRLDGTSFYRAVRTTPDPLPEGMKESGLVQGGVRFDPKRVLPSIPHEPTTQTGLSHVDGTISMARNAPGSANGDFFIVVGDTPSMDADPRLPGDNLGFAAFGHVAEGMDVIRKILLAPTSPTEGEGVMKGQMLSPVVKIITARRTQ
ncbi:peptidylprolyl isomerase [Sphingomonas quercus]|uniref:peptidylprolyl isomerase n=1 Tax=Sphingomonas quercus TaxID=2842451 RepID=A0ABS6BGG6_9SPHN|nr:peptidylprolyl isomerase [Sphingomonas quercus]MBU3076672.1 peptidylprolyl isomerase [Sphingomonas quercus]